MNARAVTAGRIFQLAAASLLCIACSACGLFDDPLKDPFYAQAENARKSGRYSEAEALYLSSADAAKNDASHGNTKRMLALHGLADCYADQKKFEDADRVYRQLLALIESSSLLSDEGKLKQKALVALLWAHRALVPLNRLAEGEFLLREAQASMTQRPTTAELLMVNDLLTASFILSGKYREAMANAQLNPVAVEKLETEFQTKVAKAGGSLSEHMERKIF